MRRVTTRGAWQYGYGGADGTGRGAAAGAACDGGCATAVPARGCAVRARVPRESPSLSLRAGHLEPPPPPLLLAPSTLLLLCSRPLVLARTGAYFVLGGGQRGNTVLLVGPSGAGKTSLFTQASAAAPVLPQLHPCIHRPMRPRSGGCPQGKAH